MEASSYSPAQQALIDVWDRHTAAEFELKDADAAVATMTDRPALTHVPVATGATGRQEVRDFYAKTFIPQTPPDLTLQLLHRAVTDCCLIDEFVLRLTHSVQMDWFAPGIPATGKTIVLPHVGVITFEDGLIASERIYWDHASLLLQLGVLEADRYPALDHRQADRLLDPSSATNWLIDQAQQGP